MLLCVKMHLAIYVCVEAGGPCWVSSYCSPHYSFEIGSLTEAEVWPATEFP